MSNIPAGEIPPFQIPWSMYSWDHGSLQHQRQVAWLIPLDVKYSSRGDTSIPNPMVHVQLGPWVAPASAPGCLVDPPGCQIFQQGRYLHSKSHGPCTVGIMGRSSISARLLG